MDMTVVGEEELQLMDAPEPFQEPTAEMIQRHAKRSAVAAGSAVLGLPGDAASMAKSIAGLEEYIPVPDFMKQEPNFLQRGLQSLVEKIPTSGKIKESMIVADPSLAPQNEYEELADDIIADFAVLALPIKGKPPFVRALGNSVFANLAKEGVKQLGGDPLVQGITKLGAMFIGGLVGRPGAEKTVSELYSKADTLLPEAAFTDASILRKEAANIQRDISRGAMTPTKQALGKYTEDVLKNIDAEGNIAMENVAELRRNLNEIRGDPSLLQRYSKRLNAWDRALTDVAEDYGKQNPGWLKSYQEANAAFGALKKSDKAVQSILKAVNPETLAPHTSIALGIGGPAAAAGHLGAAATIGTTATGYRIMQRIATNPSLRRHYMDVMKASLQDNTAEIARTTSRLDKAMRKELEREPIPLLTFEDEQGTSPGTI